METKAVTEFYEYLSEFSDFFVDMAKCEREKLDAILQNRLPLLESTLATAQANSMKLSNFEKKRLELQKKAGFEDKTFSQLVELAPQERKQQLRSCFEKMEDSLREIKFYNTKSMELAESNLHLFGIPTREYSPESFRKVMGQQMNDTAIPRLEIKA